MNLNAQTTKLASLSLDLEGIKKIQRNRYPFLMIEAATEVIPDISATAFIDLTGDEWFFECHWEGDPNMPGMLQIEGMMQTSSLVILTKPNYGGKILYVVRVINALFKRKVVPGDKLVFHSDLKKAHRGIYKFDACGYVGDAMVCKAQFELMLPDLVATYSPNKI